MALVADLGGLESLRARLAGLSRVDTRVLLDNLSGELEEQTLARIQRTKTAPDGRAWPAWSADYARTRHAGHSLLESSGALMRSIWDFVDGRDAVVGSQLPYAAAQQARRPYLGLSRSDAERLEQVAAAFLDRVVQ